LNKWFPVILDISGSHCVVVGGGHIAARRVAALVESGARVTVISPQLHPDIARLESDGLVHILLRPYLDETDLLHANMAFAATNDPITNGRISADARSLGILINHAGDSKESTLIMPTVLRRGRLIISISTSGASPGLSVRIRNELAERYGHEYEQYIEFLAELREWISVKVSNEQCRAVIFQHVLKFDIIDIIHNDKQKAFRMWMLDLLEQDLQAEQWEQYLRDYSDYLASDRP
jgi:precorrin-2 dehydrogenase/sirohydrochlorin ferrochelatase